MKPKHILEQKHTPEPWKAEYAGEEGRLDIVAKDTGPWDGDVTLAMNIGEANARRIVACVNACAGISTENLEDNLPVKELARRYNEIIKQRDVLLAAVEACVDVLDRIKAKHGIETSAEIACRSAISIAKGSAA